MIENSSPVPANPFAPPRTEVADVPSVDVTALPFFPVSVTKLVVMSICTASLYEIYWFYKNWQLIRERGEKVVPLARAIFAVLFCYPCFNRMRATGVARGFAAGFAAGPLAAGWILTTITWKLPDPIWLITYLSVFFMIPVQRYANSVNSAVAPGHDPNARFRGWNWVALIGGGILMLLAIVGSFVPDPDGTP